MVTCLLALLAVSAAAEGEFARAEFQRVQLGDSLNRVPGARGRSSKSASRREALRPAYA